jgi:hypothetical protein
MRAGRADRGEATPRAYAPTPDTRGHDDELGLSRTDDRVDAADGGEPLVAHDGPRVPRDEIDPTAELPVRSGGESEWKGAWAARGRLLRAQGTRDTTICVLTDAPEWW